MELIWFKILTIYYLMWLCVSHSLGMGVLFCMSILICSAMYAFLPKLWNEFYIFFISKAIYFYIFFIKNHFYMSYNGLCHCYLNLNHKEFTSGTHCTLILLGILRSVWPKKTYLLKLEKKKICIFYLTKSVFFFRIGFSITGQNIVISLFQSGGIRASALMCFDRPDKRITFLW